MAVSSFCVGTLDSGVGFETQSPEEAISRHLTYWFASRRNQGKIMGNVPSWNFLWMTYNRTPDRLAEKAKEELDTYFGELFAQRTVEVTYRWLNDTRSLYSLQLSIQVISDGKLYDVGRTILKTGEYYKVLDSERLK